MGAAIATVVAQAISGILCAIFIMKKVSVLKLTKEDRVMSKPAVLNLIIMGFPMGLQYSITAIGSMVMPTPTPMRIPFLMRLRFPAPRFWLAKTDAPVAKAS